MTKTIVLYHANCMDGFASAWAHNYLKGRMMQGVEYYAMNYDQELPVNCEGEDVIMLDYIMKRAVVDTLCKIANTVTIIDHHHTAFLELIGLDIEHLNLTLHLDKAHSGCMLTWNQYANNINKKYPPKFLQLIEDRDLWLLKNKDSEAFHAKASTINKDFDIWDDFIHPNNLQELVAIGHSLLAYENKLVESIAKGKYSGLINNNQVFFCNCPYELMSKVGHFILENNIINIVCLFLVIDNQVKYSLRSNDKVDSSELASRFGGGGHKKAAGFNLPIVASHLIGSKIYSDNYVNKYEGEPK